jgi:hypothetical protein
MRQKAITIPSAVEPCPPFNFVSRVRTGSTTAEQRCNGAFGFQQEQTPASEFLLSFADDSRTAATRVLVSASDDDCGETLSVESGIRGSSESGTRCWSQSAVEGTYPHELEDSGGAEGEEMRGDVVRERSLSGHDDTLGMRIDCDDLSQPHALSSQLSTYNGTSKLIHHRPWCEAAINQPLANTSRYAPIRESYKLTLPVDAPDDLSPLVTTPKQYLNSQGYVASHVWLMTIATLLQLGPRDGSLHGHLVAINHLLWKRERRRRLVLGRMRKGRHPHLSTPQMVFVARQTTSKGGIVLGLTQSMCLPRSRLAFGLDKRVAKAVKDCCPPFGVDSSFP